MSMGVSMDSVLENPAATVLDARQRSQQDRHSQHGRAACQGVIFVSLLPERLAWKETPSW
jgi:hypothetical protein